MKNHQKYAKLPQDLDLSFQSDLDLLPDTAADIDVDEYNLSGTPPAGLVLNDDDGDDDNTVGGGGGGDNCDDDDDEDDEIVIAAQVVGGGKGGGGLRLATRHKQRKQRKQQLEQLYNKKNKICGLGSDSVIEVSQSIPIQSIVNLLLSCIDQMIKSPF